MYYSNIIRLCTQSLRWWYWISMCLDLSWNTGLIESLMQFWLSQSITVRSIWEQNKPTKIFLIQIASHATWISTMYFASVELSATDRFFLLYQENVVDPMLKIPPNLLFLSDGLPTQSASVKPWSFTPSIHLYHRTYYDVPLRYLKTCFPTFQKSFVGLIIAWLSWLTA